MEEQSYYREKCYFLNQENECADPIFSNKQKTLPVRGRAHDTAMLCWL